MGLQKNQYREMFVTHGGLLSTEDFEKVLALHNQTHRPLEDLLLERSLITGSQLLQLLESYFKVGAATLRGDEIDMRVLHSVPEHFASQYLAIAFSEDEEHVCVALEDPTDSAVLEALQEYTHKPIKPFVSLKYQLQQALILYDGEPAARIIKAAEALSEVHENASGSAVTLTEAILEAAVFMNASDIHIEPYETELLVRFRIDGQLRTIVSLPFKVIEPMLARIKILAELRVDQRRLPQDGRFAMRIKEQEVNFRVSTVPALWGEKMVIRVLLKAARSFDLSVIGLHATDLDIVRDHITRPHGLVLVTGPTGSGKTTSLYAFIQELARERIDIVNISTIEDPIEYTVPRVTQIQTQPEIDLTFASGLRALLRQDPDILMVGEIRDEETAEFAVRAALVGRLLLSSLHTNDAPSAIPRLLDMGVEPYLLSSVLTLVVAQRLARRLCTYCRESYQPDEALLSELDSAHDFKAALDRLQTMNMFTSEHATLRFFKATGCNHCGGSGYQGRLGIFELLVMTPDIQRVITERSDSGTIRTLAMQSGMKTMFEDGITKLLAGDIDLKELLQAVYS